MWKTSSHDLTGSNVLSVMSLSQVTAKMYDSTITLSDTTVIITDKDSLNPALEYIHRSWLPVLLYSVLLAWQSYCFLPSCSLSVCVNMAEITRDKQKTMSTNDAAKWTEDECDCFCLFVSCLAPPFHSCQLDCPVVAVYLRIFGFSGCCCLIWIMNPFRIPFRRCWVPVSMATENCGSERHLVR